MNPIGPTAAQASAGACSANEPRTLTHARAFVALPARGFLARWSWVILPLVVLLAVTLPKLNQGDWRGDTGWYTALGLDAARSGRWTLSAGEGEPYFNKPPLVFWIVGRVLDWFGVDLLVARLTSVLAAAIGVVATAVIARELGTRRLGAMAGVILALTYEYFRRTREISLDMWHSAFLLLAAWAVVKGAAAGSTSQVTLSQITAPSERADALGRVARRVRGCAGLDDAIHDIQGASVVDLGQTAESDLSPTIRDRINGVAVGAASPVQDNAGQASVIVVCARDTGGGGVPSHDEISDRLFQQEMELLAERYLRNLRREATIITRNNNS